MADDVRVTNFPTPASHQAVAFELFKAIRHLAANADTFDGQLDAYRACLKATYGQK